HYIDPNSSHQTLAPSLRANITPKLANAGGSASVQHSSSTDPTVIIVPGDVDFSPIPVLVPSATGFLPTSAAPGAVGNNGYSPLVQLPSGVVINAPQVGDGANTNGADKAHWTDKVDSVSAVNRTVRSDITNG